MLNSNSDMPINPLSGVRISQPNELMISLSNGSTDALRRDSFGELLRWICLGKESNPRISTNARVNNKVESCEEVIKAPEWFRAKSSGVRDNGIINHVEC